MLAAANGCQRLGGDFPQPLVFIVQCLGERWYGVGGERTDLAKRLRGVNANRLDRTRTVAGLQYPSEDVRVGAFGLQCPVDELTDLAFKDFRTKDPATRLLIGELADQRIDRRRGGRSQ